MEKKIFFASFETEVGTVHVASTEKGLAGVGISPGETAAGFRHRVTARFPGYKSVENKAANRDVERAVRDVLGTGTAAGVRGVPLDLGGTLFQRRVWNVLLSIPPGRTLSYGEVARKVGRPGAARAVGGACRANPVALLVPCHRVIGADGRMTGYGGPSGVGLKQKLLEREGWTAGGCPRKTP